MLSDRDEIWCQHYFLSGTFVSCSKSASRLLNYCLKISGLEAIGKTCLKCQLAQKIRYLKKSTCKCLTLTTFKLKKTFRMSTKNFIKPHFWFLTSTLKTQTALCIGAEGRVSFQCECGLKSVWVGVYECKVVSQRRQEVKEVQGDGDCPRVFKQTQGPLLLPFVFETLLWWYYN